jgi:hypothetical protein
MTCSGVGRQKFQARIICTRCLCRDESHTGSQLGSSGWALERRNGVQSGGPVAKRYQAHQTVREC